MTSLKFKILYLSLLFIFLSASCSGDADSPHVKNWMILYSQEQSFESILNKSGWQPIEAPSDIKLPYSQCRTFQYAWLKGDFEIKDDPSRYHGLSTGRIRFADRFFVNNYNIGSCSPERVSRNPIPRNYIIPEGILKTGKNVVHIQIGLYGDEPGGISGRVLIQDNKKFDRAWLFNNLVYNLLPFGIIFLYLGLILEFLISHFWDRKERQYLFFSLSLIMAVIYVSMFLPSYIRVGFELSSAIKISIPLIIFIFIMLLIQSMYRIYLTTLNQITIPLLACLSISIIIFMSKFHYPLIVAVLSMTAYSLILFIFTYMILRLNAIKRSTSEGPDKFLRYISISILLMFSLLIIFESYFLLSRSYYPGFISVYIPPIFIIFHTNILSWQVRNRRIELQTLYSKLKIIKGQEKDKIVSDTLKEKLKRVIDFIDENFSSDLSREGLAAAVDLHPNYMGSQFKIYTGETINTYINQLRINEALRQIESGNSKIIDIAFKVGFESLSTFHRVFKKITGKTPQEYKKDN